MSEINYDEEEAKSPIRYEDEKPLEQPLMEVLQALSSGEYILFSVRPGGFGALMGPDFSCKKIPHPWIKRLVSRAYIDQEKSSRGKLARMGWFEYQLTYEGQQALNRRHR